MMLLNMKHNFIQYHESATMYKHNTNIFTAVLKNHSNTFTE